VAVGRVERGIAVCGSGAGASICANKVPGICAALIHDHFSARQAVEDDHMNIICMGGRTVGLGVVRLELPLDDSDAGTCPELVGQVGVLQRRK
jgi:ribose 5-phosphate isomerase B